MRPDYVAKRFGLFLLVIWLAATLNFFLPRMSGNDPVREKLLQQALTGGYVQAGMQQMVEEYQTKFGLDKPLWQQYLNYLGDMARFDFGYSISNYPKQVMDIIRDAIPWTIGLLGTTILVAVFVGSLLGALLAWPRTPRFLHLLVPPLLTLSAIPYYLLGLVLLYFFSFQWKLFPIFGGYTAGTIPAWTPEFWFDVLRHATLPALSIVLASVGFWALGMRAMMVTTQGEDYMTFAEAKGLRNNTLFRRYAIRNALLPQTTALVLTLGHILSGAVLVEVVFAYPGLGTVLYRAIREYDYFLIQGVTFLIIVSIALSTFILDLIYPLLDPRISYRRT
ncbi:MAG: ABC transporter permease [Chloroflexi bacterium]|nr:ABC transporter permease [Chloroflexota bacterium]